MLLLKSWLHYSFFQIGNFDFQVTHLIKLVLIIVCVKAITWIMAIYFNRQVRKKRVDKGSAYAFRQIFSYFLWVIAIIISLQAIGLNISILLAGSAALLVGVGMGIQQTFNDFFSGIILLMEGSIKVDDVLEFDNMVCRVQHIGVRTSMVVTRDEISVIVPNSKFTSDSVINWTHSAKAARFHIDIGVSYDSNVELVEKVLHDVIIAHEDILKSPKPIIRLMKFNDSSLDFGIYFWSDKVFNVEQTKSDVRFSIVNKFRENGITIPFPQRDLHVIQKETESIKVMS
jgi:small-conductance mechanosensitive channel